MKRNENLKTLSWEHHDGLVTSFRLQQGLKNNTNFKELADYILHTWKNVLEHHFWQEEQALLKNKIHTKKSSEYISQLVYEHNQIRELISKIGGTSSNTQLISDFATLLNKHIRFEERKLFPLIEQESTVEELDEIGKFLKAHHIHSCEVWPNQFWKIEKIGN